MQSFHLAQLLAASLGGFFGAGARFIVSNQVYAWLGRDFAWGTLTVNVIGSFIIGFLAMLFIDKVHLSVEMRTFIIVGFLGSFTTFSTFSHETFLFLQSGEYLKAFLNISVSVLTGLIAVAIGIWAGKHFLAT